MFKPHRLGEISIPDDELLIDKKNCRKIGPCGIGEKALYLNSFYIDRIYYIPIHSVRRIFKRVAMSKGGFTGKEYLEHYPILWLHMAMVRKSNAISNTKKMWTGSLLI